MSASERCRGRLMVPIPSGWAKRVVTQNVVTAKRHVPRKNTGWSSVVEDSYGKAPHTDTAVEAREYTLEFSAREQTVENMRGSSCSFECMRGW